MKKSEQGFTLIEMMVTVMIITILASIAVPSYQRYMIINAEKQAQAQIGQLEIQLEKWRAQALTYRGFVPSGGYDNKLPNANSSVADKTIILVPSGSNKDNYRYMIQLVDGTSFEGLGSLNNKGLSLVPTDETKNAGIALGHSWKMVAYPNPRFSKQGANRFIARSSGVRCMAPDKNRVVQMTTSNCSGRGVESW